MAAHCCTAQIVKRWEWVSFGEKLGESKFKVRIQSDGSHNTIFITDTIGLTAIILT